MAVKNLKYALLLDVYGTMLNEKQRYALEMYYCDDLSLSEIADNIGITRQGVRDQIKHAEEELDNLDSKLGLIDKFDELRKVIVEIENVAENELVKSLCSRVKSLLEA